MMLSKTRMGRFDPAADTSILKLRSVLDDGDAVVIGAGALLPQMRTAYVHEPSVRRYFCGG